MKHLNKTYHIRTQIHLGRKLIPHGGLNHQPEQAELPIRPMLRAPLGLVTCDWNIKRFRPWIVSGMTCFGDGIGSIVGGLVSRGRALCLHLRFYTVLLLVLVLAPFLL